VADSNQSGGRFDAVLSQLVKALSGHNVAEANKVADAISESATDLPAAEYWRLRALLSELLLTWQSEKQSPPSDVQDAKWWADALAKGEVSLDAWADALVKGKMALPEVPDCPIAGCHVEIQEVDPVWAHIRQFLPEHMRDDPDVEWHAGFLLGLYGEKLIGRVLRHFGIIP
jgi:hypothetical protein